MKIYLAGPDVFLPDAAEIGRRKKELCARYGFTGLFPLDAAAAPAVGEPTDLAIYRANVAMIRRADLGIVNLTPFRGPSADAGTVFELGMLVGLSKPVLGYTNEILDLRGRVARLEPLVFDATAGLWRDEAGMFVEDFGNADNLMIDAALLDQGAPVIRHDARPGERFHDLAGFEACLAQAARARSRRTADVVWPWGGAIEAGGAMLSQGTRGGAPSPPESSKR